MKYQEDEKRYMKFIGTTLFKPCFAGDCHRGFVNYFDKDFKLKQVNIRWKYEKNYIGCVKAMTTNSTDIPNMRMMMEGLN